MPKLQDDRQMDRVSIRLPKDTLDALNQMALDSGMYQPHFYQAALIAGARHLAQHFSYQIELQPVKYRRVPSKVELVREASLQKKAERLRSSRQGAVKRRSRAQDYMDGLLSHEELGEE